MTSRTRHRVQGRYAGLLAMVVMLVILLLCAPVTDSDSVDSVLRFSGPWLSGASLLLLFGSLVYCLTPAGALKIGGAKADVRLPTPLWLVAVYSVVTANSFLIWSAAEPIFHFIDNPLYQNGFPGSSQATASALSLTFNHWGTLSVTAIAGFCIAWSRLDPAESASLDHRMADLRTPVVVLLASFCLLGSVSLLSEHLVQVLSVIDQSLFTGRLIIRSDTQAGSDLALHAGILIAISGSVAALIWALLRRPPAGFILFGVIALMAGIAFLVSISMFDSDSRRAPDSVAAISFNILKDLYRSVDLALAADIQTGLVDWQQNWSAHYARSGLLSAPIYALTLLHLSEGRRGRHLVFAVFTINLITTLAWLMIIGGRSVTIANTDSQFVTQVMVQISVASQQIVSNLHIDATTIDRLQSLFAITAATHWVAAFAVIACGVSRIRSICHAPTDTRAQVVLCLLVAILSMLLALHPDLNHRASMLAALIAPVLAAVVLIQVVKRISARTEPTR